MSYSPDGKHIVSGSVDQTLKVWHAEKGTEILTLKGHTSYVWSVAWSPDGKRIVSASYDNTLKVWDADEGHEVRTLKGHTHWVTSVTYSPNGKRIVSGSRDKTLKVWDADKGQELLSLKGHASEVHSVSWSPDGKRIVSGSEDGILEVWDADRHHTLFSLGVIPSGGQQFVVGETKRRFQELVSLEGHSEGATSARAGTGNVLDWDALLGPAGKEAVTPDGSLRVFHENMEIKVVHIEEQKRQEALDRAFLARLARPDPAYHRRHADQYKKPGDLFAAAFHLRRLLLLDPKDNTVRQRLAAVQARLDAQAKIDAALPQKPPAKMPYAR